jgi:hypothetical protein
MSTTNTEPKTRNQKVDEEMMRAITTYTGPVTRCEPGEARAPPRKRRRPRTEAEKLVQRTTAYLYRHRYDPPVSETDPERRRRIRIERMEREKREKIARRNRRIIRARGL